MRTSTIFALLAVALTTVLAAPSPSHRGGAAPLARDVDLGAILAQLKLTVAGVQAALVKANADLEDALEGSELLARFQAVLIPAEAEATRIIESALAAAPGLTVPELVALAQETAASLEQLANSTVAQLLAILAAGDLEQLLLIIQIENLLEALLEEIQAQVRPLLDLLAPLLPPPAGPASSVDASLGEIIAQLEATIAGINAAILRANDELNVLLTGYNLYAPIEEILLAAQLESDQLVRDALAKAPGLTLAQLVELAQTTVAELELIQVRSAGEVQAIIRESAPELLPQIQLITIAMQDEVLAQLQALLDVLTPAPAPATTAAP